MGRMKLGALVMVLLMLVAACGGGEGDGGADTTAAATGTEAGTEETTGGGDGTSAGGGDGEFAGVELALLIHPTLYAATGDDGGLVAEFEEATGASVEVVTAPIGEHLERSMAEFASGSGRFDVINMQGQDLHADITPFLLDLAPYVSEAGEWDYEDFPESLRTPATNDEGAIAGIPFRIGVTMMYYRADLLEAAGVEAPTTFDEFRTVAEALYEQDPSVTPLVQRGKAEEIVHDWLAFLHAAGGDLLSEDYSACTVNSEAGVKAATFWADFYEAGYLPDDLFALGRDDYIASMRQGRSAMGLYFSPYWGTITEEGSEYAEDMSWAIMPTEEGVEPGTAWYQAWYLTVAKDSKNPEAAWALVKHITNKENSLRSALDWANGPVRASVYEDPSYVEEFPLAEDWLTAVAASRALPAVPTNTQIVDTLSQELVDIVAGDKDPQQGLDDACSVIDGLL